HHIFWIPFCRDRLSHFQIDVLATGFGCVGGLCRFGSPVVSGTAPWNLFVSLPCGHLPALRSIADPVAHHRRCGRSTMEGAGQGGSVSRLRTNPWDVGGVRYEVERGLIPKSSACVSVAIGKPSDLCWPM